MDPIPKQQSVDIPKPYEDERAKHWFLLDYEKLKRVLESLDCLTVRGSQVIAYSYVNTQSSRMHELHNGPMEFEVPTDIPRLLEGIGDIGMNEEFPNNFMIALAVELPDGTRLLIQYDCDEQPSVCETCEPTHYDVMRSCEHGNDYVSAGYTLHHGEISDESVEQSMYFL